ncbi:alpha/beta fold hydrolase [Streptomyces sp. NPDC059209]|uniref:alpha/beta fold hydrolase n=1 Tax=Streptomyces sp. NPDC059209 TaxID=3346769 RepID=UPI00367A4ECF
MGKETRTKVLVHGLPETSAVWEPLLEELVKLGHRDVVRLSPPAFGAPRPDGFSATVEGYRDWLVGELSAFGAPVDLVGHDFGGVHAVNVAISRPGLLHSWVSDVAGVFEPDYVWHPYAQIMMTPGEGERAIGELVGAELPDRVAINVQGGIPEPAAGKVAAGQTVEMGKAVLSLYRSARQPALADRGRDLAAAAARPGLVLIATEDHAVGSLEQRRRAAERAGARSATLTGLGHWWMLEDPALGAKVLAEFWEGLPA